MQAEVVIDVGDETLVVDPYGDPARFRRVPRRAVTNGVPKATPAPAPKAPVAASPSPVRKFDDLTCIETEHGWCATQIQARRLTRPDVAEGVWTVCCIWAESRSVPPRRAPTCSRCRGQLGMPSVREERDD